MICGNDDAMKGPFIWRYDSLHERRAMTDVSLTSEEILVFPWWSGKNFRTPYNCNDACSRRRCHAQNGYELIKIKINWSLYG
jgi:hypothetical protein